jgi:hypothetical protein
VIKTVLEELVSSRMKRAQLTRHYPVPIGDLGQSVRYGGQHELCQNNHFQQPLSTYGCIIIVLYHSGGLCFCLKNNLNTKVMAMMRYLPILLLLLPAAACKMERPAQDQLPVAPDHDDIAAQVAPSTEITDWEMEMFAKANHLAAQLEIDPLTETVSMKPIVESCGLTMERYREIRSAVEESERLQRRKDQLVRKLRD